MTTAPDRRREPTPHPDPNPQLTAAYLALGSAFREIELAIVGTLTQVARAYLATLPAAGLIADDPTPPDPPLWFDLPAEPIDPDIRLMDQRGCIWYKTNGRFIPVWVCDRELTPRSYSTSERHQWFNLLRFHGPLREWRADGGLVP